MEPKPPNLFELIENWLTSKGYEFTTSNSHGKTINLDVPSVGVPTHTINIMEDTEKPHGIIVLATGIYPKEEDAKNKVNCSPSHKFDDAVYSVGIGFSHLDAREPDFFDRLLTILSSPPSNSLSFDMLSSWDENEKGKC